MTEDDAEMGDVKSFNLLTNLQEETNRTPNADEKKLQNVYDKLCEICEEARCKYKCPGCMRATCSVLCVKEHKKRFNCPGERDKTSYLCLKEMDNISFLSDYRFLENICCQSENMQRENFRVPKHLPKFLNTMMYHARARSIYLKIMPHTFRRRKTNSTKYMYGTKHFDWHVEFVFVNSKVTLSSRHHEDKLLSEIISEHLDPAKVALFLWNELQGAYKDAWPEAYAVYMKVEGWKGPEKRYYQLDITKSLNENLKNKMIIEFPTVYVALESSAEDFSVISQSELETLVKKKGDEQMLHSSSGRGRHRGNYRGRCGRFRGRGRRGVFRGRTKE